MDVSTFKFSSVYWGITRLDHHLLPKILLESVKERKALLTA